MKNTLSRSLGYALGCALALLVFAADCQAQTSTFTYQGNLTIGGALANGGYDLQFKLYDQLSGGALQGSPSTVTVSGVTVTAGVFTVELDFGAAAFPGAARFMEISVRPAGSGGFTTLSPRQQLSSTPYAIRSLSAASADTATSATNAANFSGSLSGDVTGTQGATVVSLVGGVTASNVASGATAANNATDANTPNAIVKRDAAGGFSAGTVSASAFNGSGSNLTNLSASNITSGSLLDSLLSGNVARLNTAQTFTANQTISANLFQSGSLVQFTPTNGFVAGGTENIGSVPASGAGVRMMWYPGKAAFRAGRVDGTEWDDANVGLASVAFGSNARASGVFSIAMGVSASSSGNSSFAAGNGVTASGTASVAMGISSSASGQASVAIGQNSQASGAHSVALGTFASTNNRSGSFVFSDSSLFATFAATANNQFNVRAAGGLRFFTTSDTSDETKPGLFISGTTGNTQINGDLSVSGTLSANVVGTATSATNFTGALFGDVTGTQSATVVANVGGVTADNVASGATLANNATNANTPGAIVRRDTAGNFSTGAITASAFSGSGANLIDLNASNIISGTLSDSLLSSNVAKLNTAQTFTADQTVSASLIQSGSLVQLAPTNGFFVGGADSNGSVPITGKGTRMMWYPDKAAFRAGKVSDNNSSTVWDAANIGDSSVAFGDNTLASGDWALAMGYNAKATGSPSVAIGYFAVASGSESVALGRCGSSSLQSVCLGAGTSSGILSVSLGSSTASGNYTTAMGIRASTNGMQGSFVYGDSSSGSNTMSATATNQFNVRAAGGYRFFASSDTSDSTKPGLFISGTTGNTQINGELSVSGSISGTFSGGGASLTGLNAGNITSGVLAIANGGTGSSTQNFVDLSSNQTSIGGNKTFNGTVTASSFSGSGSSLTGLNASNITSGLLGIANGGTGSSTQNFVDLSSNQASIGGNKTFTGLLTASTFSGSGSSLTGLNAGNISSGTLSDARLSSNVALASAANTFTANQTINANLIQNGTLAQFTATDGFVAKGTLNSGSIPATGAGARMMWYPGAAAFRAGYVTGAQWDTPGDYSTAFGYDAKASGSSSFAVGGGATASGNDSIALGNSAVASFTGAIALGNDTTASGRYSTAIGSNASTNGKNGSFVYGDISTTSTINATVDNQFVVRAQQFWFGTSNSVTSTSGRFLETSTGAYLTTGGTWTNSSSRALKTNFSPVNAREVLRKVLQLPMQTWNYKAEDAHVRHLGAISQDFNRLFGLGDSAETISTVDADGVAMAAIQGLHEELKDRDARIERLEQQSKEQQALIDGLRKLLCAHTPRAEVCQQ